MEVGGVVILYAKEPFVVCREGELAIAPYAISKLHLASLLRQRVFSFIGGSFTGIA